MSFVVFHCLFLFFVVNIHFKIVRHKVTILTSAVDVNYYNLSTIAGFSLEL